MACNSCRKNNMSESQNPVTPNPVPFRKEEVPVATNGIAKKMNMVKSFATALTSRGLTNEKVSKATKQLRVLSCFGNGDVLPPCEQLKKSTTEAGKHFCGGCGCGDKKGTWLISDSDSYSKLDYPKLNCPLQMPGFTNYKESTPDEAVSPITRRYYVENISYRELEKISVTLHGAPIDPKKTAPNP